MSIEVPCDLKAPLISVSLASLCAHPCLDYISSMFNKSKNSIWIATHFVRRTIFFLVSHLLVKKPVLLADSLRRRWLCRLECNKGPGSLLILHPSPWAFSFDLVPALVPLLHSNRKNVVTQDQLEKFHTWENKQSNKQTKTTNPLPPNARSLPQTT